MYIYQSTFRQLNQTTPAEWSYVHVDSAVVIWCVLTAKKYRSMSYDFPCTRPTDNYPFLPLSLRLSSNWICRARATSASRLKCRLRATRRDSRNKKGDALGRVSCSDRAEVLPMLTVLVSFCTTLHRSLPLYLMLTVCSRSLSTPYVYALRSFLLFRWIFWSAFYFIGRASSLFTISLPCVDVHVVGVYFFQ